MFPDIGSYFSSPLSGTEFSLPFSIPITPADWGRFSGPPAFLLNDHLFFIRKVSVLYPRVINRIV